MDKINKSLKEFQRSPGEKRGEGNEKNCLRHENGSRSNEENTN